MSMEREKIISLVERSQSGDKDALNELLTACYQDFHYFALKTVKDENIAYDITQESCIEIMQTIGNLHEPAAFKKWSRQVIYHQCTRHFRKRQDVQVEEDEDGYTIFDKLPDESDESLPEFVLEDKEFRKTIMDLVMSLPEEQRSAILLYYYERISVKEIAEIQELNEGTVKSHLNYGRKAIKKKVEEYEERTGTKLHGMLPLLLLRLFKEEKSELPVLPSIPNIAGTAAGTAASASASASATTATTAATAAAGIAAKGATAAVIKTATVSLATKIIAAVVGAVTVGSAVIGGVVMTTDNFGNDSKDHEHEFSEEYFYNERKHWQVCEECDDRSDKKEHKFVGSACKVCGYRTASQGLYMEKVGDQYYEVAGIGTCTDKDIVIPSEYKGKPVIKFSDYAMKDCTEIESIVIPDSFSFVGDHVFWGCTSLKKVTLPDNMSSFSGYAFGNCTSLTDINFPKSLHSIDRFAFSGCVGFEEIKISGEVKEIGTGAFYKCKNLKKVYLPGTVELLSHSAFYQCPNLTDVYFNGTMKQWNRIETDETSFELTVGISGKILLLPFTVLTVI